VKSAKPDLDIDIKAKKVCRDNIEIPLTKTEFKILEYLHNHLKEYCHVDDIAENVWEDAYKRSDSVSQYIRRLRKKIESTPAEPRYIVTKPGRHGCYRLSL
jgi:DNA-binding response OmpR family regulator